MDMTATTSSWTSGRSTPIIRWRRDEPMRPMATLRDGIQSEMLRRLHDYWDAKRGDRLFPARRDLDPLEFGFALGHVVLVEVTRPPLRFRFRLVGTEVVRYE